jgi:hypothetical protein
MKSIVIILLFFLVTKIYGQKSIDWQKVQLFQFTSTKYPFDRPEYSDSNFAIGERRIKFKYGQKSLTDISAKNIIKLKKKLAKIGAEIVYIDLTNLHDMNDQKKNEYYILYLTRQK